MLNHFNIFRSFILSYGFVQLAVKVFDRAKLSEEEARHVGLEVDLLMKRVRHPHIVRVLEAVEGRAGRLYVIMELARGGELFDRIVARDHYSEADARAIVRNILSAIDHLHRMHIAHR